MLINMKTYNGEGSDQCATRSSVVDKRQFVVQLAASADGSVLTTLIISPRGRKSKEVEEKC